MNELDKQRKIIKETDAQMAKLFQKRMECVEQIALYKKSNALPIYDSKREAELLAENSALIEDETIRQYYFDFLKSNMAISKAYQQRLLNGLKIAYSGVPGAFAHIAAEKMFPGATHIACRSFDEAYKKVEDGQADTCVLPIENSTAGDVGTVMDLIFSGSLFINRMFELEVDQCLLAKEGASVFDIKTVVSHPQALEQCRQYINEHGFAEKEATNTAVSAKAVAEGDDKTVAVIASDRTGELYGLKVLANRINQSRNNTTRFAAFAKSLNIPDKSVKMGEHFILVFTVKNEAGALAKCLDIIGAHGFNMRNLRSRPMKELMWNYYFFVELEGNVNTEDGNTMMRALQTLCDRLKLVGTYYSFCEK